MAKGAEAKTNLIKRFAAAVGADYLGEQDKKYYFNSTENGETVQIAISMTCPKTPVIFDGYGGDLDFDSDSGTTATKAEELPSDEKATLERLMNELGL